jgi:hypothetical protein
MQFSARSWLTGAGQQPRHNLPIRIAAERDSSHRVPSESFDLLFGLSLVFRKSHLLADDFPALLVFRLHAQGPLVSTVLDGSYKGASRL